MELKTTTIDWLELIPRDWRELKIKHLFRHRVEKVSDKVYPPLSVTKKGIVPQLDNVAKSDNSNDRKKVCIGDFVINSRSDRKGSSGSSNYEGSVSLINTVLEPKGIESKYAEYLFKSKEFIEEFFRNGRGIHWDLWSTNYSRMADIKVPVPTKDYQLKAIEYLESKLESIDELTFQLEKKVQLLKEKRSSVINAAVTKGLNPEVEMKDSGVDWIGTMPNHWVKKKVSWISKVASGTTPKSDNKEYYQNGTVKWLNTGDLNDGFLSTTKKLITQKAVDDCKLTEYNSYSVVVAMYGATIGKTSVITEPMTVNQACCVIYDIKEVSPNWVYYVFLASKSYLIFQGEGGGQPNINQETIRSHFVTIPPSSEQNNILTFLNEQTELIDKSVSIEEERIDLLKEYRQSLISSVVTGKIKLTEDA